MRKLAVGLAIASVAMALLGGPARAYTRSSPCS